MLSTFVSGLTAVRHAVEPEHVADVGEDEQVVIPRAADRDGWDAPLLAAQSVAVHAVSRRR